MQREILCDTATNSSEDATVETPLMKAHVIKSSVYIAILHN
jgi:hypothetical protein